LFLWNNFSFEVFFYGINFFRKFFLLYILQFSFSILLLLNFFFPSSI
jgi:hypothetical protein